MVISLSVALEKLTFNRKMKSSRVKSFMELPKIYRSSSRCLSTSDIYIFDDSSVTMSSSTSTIQSPFGIQNFDTSSELSTEIENYSFTPTLKSSQVSFNRRNNSQVSENEGGSKNSNNSVGDTNQQQRRYKSLLSLIKVLKNFSMGLKSESNNSTETNRNISIYRQLKRPREYIYVKGMSGLSNRIEKAPTSSSSCNRCSMRCG